MNNFQLDIITPGNIISYQNVSYLRIPSLDGLTGIQAKHANSIIALDIGEIKITIDGKDQYFSTSGGFGDIQSESVQLLIESFEACDAIDKDRAQKSLKRAEKRIKDKSMDLVRAEIALKRANNRLRVSDKL